MSEQRNWLVERREDWFETISAESMSLDASGAIRFWSGGLFEQRLDLIIAAGQWITVCMDEDPTPAPVRDDAGGLGMSEREVIHDQTCGVPTGRTWACACNERNGYRDSTPPLEPVAAQTGCPTPWWLKQGR